MPIALGWAKAIHSFTPSSPVLRHRLQLLTGMSHLSGVRFQVSPPGILGSSSLSLALGVPGKSLARDVAGWFSQGVSYPSPFSPLDLVLGW